MNEASLTGESQAVDKQTVDNLHKILLFRKNQYGFHGHYSGRRTA